MSFVAAQFIAGFDRQLKKLGAAERVTKQTLQTMSRDLLSLLHTKNDRQGDIGFVNRTIAVLTPVNRKVFVEFTKEFTGFILNDEGSAYIKKSKAHYDAVQAKALAWLEDPTNNIWSWADREIQIERKEFDLDKAKDAVKKLMLKAQKANISKADMLAIFMAQDFTASELVDCMEAIGKLDEVATDMDSKFDIAHK